MNFRSHRREEWIRFLNSEIESIQNSGPVRVGIVGALGAHDVGDEAMYCSLTEELRENKEGVVFVPFSTRPALTESYLNVRCCATLHSWYYETHSLGVRAFRLMAKLEAGFWKIAKHLPGIAETTQGGWSVRLAAVILRRKIDRKIELPDALSPTVVEQHIEDLRGLDCLIYLGGGYINSWHVKGFSYIYLLTGYTASKLDIPVFASGLNLGPFNKHDLKRLPRYLRRFQRIGLRDEDESIRDLKAMGIYDPDRHVYSGDDATHLTSNESSKDADLIAVHMHKWGLSNSGQEDLMDAFAANLRQISEHAPNLKIILVPMTFAESGLSKDSQILLRLKDKIEALMPKTPVNLASDSLSPAQRKSLFQTARVSIVTRHHAFLFSITGGTPSVAISLDDYYSMKLRGISADSPVACTVVDLQDFEASGDRSLLELWKETGSPS